MEANFYKPRKDYYAFTLLPLISFVHDDEGNYIGLGWLFWFVEFEL